jgi:hypothetical protein
MDIYVATITFFQNVPLKMVMIVYISECAPVHLRGNLSSSSFKSNFYLGPVALLLSTGNFIVQLCLQPLIWPTVFGNEEKWIFLPTIALILCAFHLAIASFLPESPKHLYLNEHNRVEAKRSLKFYHGYNIDTAEIFEHYEQERELVGAEHLSLKEVWENKPTR